MHRVTTNLDIVRIALDGGVVTLAAILSVICWPHVRTACTAWAQWQDPGQPVRFGTGIWGTAMGVLLIRGYWLLGRVLSRDIGPSPAWSNTGQWWGLLVILVFAGYYLHLQSLLPYHHWLVRWIWLCLPLYALLAWIRCCWG